MLLQGAAVSVECALWTGHAGATARCLQGAVPLQGAACRVLLEQWCVRFGAGMLVLLEGVAARCLWQCGRWALMEITFTVCRGKKGEPLVAPQKYVLLSGVYAGVIIIVINDNCCCWLVGWSVGRLVGWSLLSLLSLSLWSLLSLSLWSLSLWSLSLSLSLLLFFVVVSVVVVVFFHTIAEFF